MNIIKRPTGVNSKRQLYGAECRFFMLKNICSLLFRQFLRNFAVSLSSSFGEMIHIYIF